MVRNAIRNGVEITRAGLGYMLTPEDGKNVDGEVSLEQLRWEVAGVCDTKDKRVIIEDPDDEKGIYIAEKLTVLPRVMSISERRGKICDGSRKIFSSCHRALQVKKVGAKKQTSIVDIFCKKKTEKVYPRKIHSTPICIKFICSHSYAYIGGSLYIALYLRERLPGRVQWWEVNVRSQKLRKSTTVQIF